MPKVFISHSNRDSEATLLIAEALRRAGYDVWVDFENLRGGADWLCEIQAGIERCDAVVTVLSKQSRSSVWVERECLYAFQLDKPLFTALIDNVRLPLHLINIQYCDFRENFTDGAAGLVKSLRTRLNSTDDVASYESLAHSSRPNSANFFPYLGQLPHGETATLVAKDLFYWAGEIADEVAFGGKVNPGLHARIELAGQQLTVFSIWAYPKNPSLQLPLDYLAAHEPFHSRQVRRRALHQLNDILPKGMRFKMHSADRRPTFPLHVLSSADKLEALKRLVREIIDGLRAKA